MFNEEIDKVVESAFFDVTDPAVQRALALAVAVNSPELRDVDRLSDLRRVRWQLMAALRLMVTENFHAVAVTMRGALRESGRMLHPKRPLPPALQAKCKVKPPPTG